MSFATGGYLVRPSIIGVWVGFLPGLGSSVADWFAYAHAVQTEKNRENFGKGDVRGVIASEVFEQCQGSRRLHPDSRLRHSRRHFDRRWS